MKKFRVYYTIRGYSVIEAKNLKAAERKMSEGKYWPNPSTEQTTETEIYDSMTNDKVDGEPPNPKALINVQGGIVRAVHLDKGILDYRVLDFDEGVDDRGLVPVPFDRYGLLLEKGEKKAKAWIGGLEHADNQQGHIVEHVFKSA